MVFRLMIPLSSGCILQMLEQLINDELTISADATAIAIKTESSQTDVKVRFNYGNSIGGTFNQTDVAIPQIQFTTINQTYYDSKINNSSIVCPKSKMLVSIPILTKISMAKSMLRKTAKSCLILIDTMPVLPLFHTLR
jgi:hypothetical protein